MDSNQPLLTLICHELYGEPFVKLPLSDIIDFTSQLPYSITDLETANFLTALNHHTNTYAQKTFTKAEFVEFFQSVIVEWSPDLNTASTSLPNLRGEYMETRKVNRVSRAVRRTSLLATAIRNSPLPEYQDSGIEIRFDDRPSSSLITPSALDRRAGNNVSRNSIHMDQYNYKGTPILKKQLSLDGRFDSQPINSFDSIEAEKEVNLIPKLGDEKRSLRRQFSELSKKLSTEQGSYKALAAEAKRQIQELETQAEALQIQIKVQNKQIFELNQTKDSQNNALKAIEEENDNLVKKSQQISTEMAGCKRQMGGYLRREKMISQEVDSLKKRLETVKDDLYRAHKFKAKLIADRSHMNHTLAQLTLERDRTQLELQQIKSQQKSKDSPSPGLIKEEAPVTLPNMDLESGVELNPTVQMDRSKSMSKKWMDRFDSIRGQRIGKLNLNFRSATPSPIMLPCQPISLNHNTELANHALDRVWQLVEELKIEMEQPLSVGEDHNVAEANSLPAKLQELFDLKHQFILNSHLLSTSSSFHTPTLNPEIDHLSSNLSSSEPSPHIRNKRGLLHSNTFDHINSNHSGSPKRLSMLLNSPLTRSTGSGILGNLELARSSTESLGLDCFVVGQSNIDLDFNDLQGIELTTKQYDDRSYCQNMQTDSPESEGEDGGRDTPRANPKTKTQSTANLSHLYQSESNIEVTKFESNLSKSLNQLKQDVIEPTITEINQSESEELAVNNRSIVTSLPSSPIPTPIRESVSLPQQTFHLDVKETEKIQSTLIYSGLESSPIHEAVMTPPILTMGIMTPIGSIPSLTTHEDYDSSHKANISAASSATDSLRQLSSASSATKEESYGVGRGGLLRERSHVKVAMVSDKSTDDSISSDSTDQNDGLGGDSSLSSLISSSESDPPVSTIAEIKDTKETDQILINDTVVLSRDPYELVKNSTHHPRASTSTIATYQLEELLSEINTIPLRNYTYQDQVTQTDTSLSLKPNNKAISPNQRTLLLRRQSMKIRSNSPIPTRHHSPNNLIRNGIGHKKNPTGSPFFGKPIDGLAMTLNNKKVEPRSLVKGIKHRITRPGPPKALPITALSPIGHNNEAVTMTSSLTATDSLNQANLNQFEFKDNYRELFHLRETVGLNTPLGYSSCSFEQINHELDATKGILSPLPTISTSTWNRSIWQPFGLEPGQMITPPIQDTDSNFSFEMLPSLPRQFNNLDYDDKDFQFELENCPSYFDHPNFKESDDMEERLVNMHNRFRGYRAQFN